MTTALQRAVIRSIRRCKVAKPLATINSNNAHHLCSNRLQLTKAQHETPLPSRCYGSAAMEGSNSNSAEETSNSYVSPFQEIFDTIEEGKTFLGTTEFQYPDVKLLKCGVAEHLLRFKTTTYGRLLEEPFVRPNEHRVILQVAIRHIPLNEIERIVLKEIVGSRLNDDTGVLQLSSSQFGSRIENKRHVVSMLERAVESAKKLAVRITDEEGEVSTAAP